MYSYEVTGQDGQRISEEVNGLLESLHALMFSVHVAPTPRHVRVQFQCTGTRKQHLTIFQSLQQSGKFESVTSLGPVQAE